MTDPFTSLSLATSIFQILDCSATLLKQAHGIHKARNGSPAELQSLEASVSRLQRLSADLDTSNLNKTMDILFKDQQEATKLADSCKSLATKFIEVLQEYKPSKQQSIRKSFKLAAKYEWQKDKLATYEQELKNKQDDARDFMIQTLCESFGPLNV
jgi:hypothetical protein